VTVAAVVAVLAAACSGGGSGDRAVDSRSRPVTKPRATPSGAPTSIVQLGDSIASGEGTLYGYTYDPHSQEWTGGNIDATWPPPYPLCHDSPDAYGNVVARTFGATFTQFACTGAQFANGFSTAETSDGTQLRPAEFGNWSTQTELNAAYDAAKPDLVLVTLGADDLQFVPIVEACIENGYEYYFDLASLQCTAKNPGSTIQSDYFGFLPTLKKNYGTIVSWIEARAKANNVPVPKIVFTNYADPLPPNGQKCPDTSYLYPAQVRYLSSLVTQLDQTILSTINGLKDPNVAVADISQAYSPQGVSHSWCTADPWAYGLSIYHVYDPSSFDSQAPFHPTPDGQNSIAAYVIGTARQFFAAPALVPTTVSGHAGSSSASTAPSTTASVSTTAPASTTAAPSSTTRGSTTTVAGSTTTKP
jgi:lysophospholipase L1-like esterase